MGEFIRPYLEPIAAWFNTLPIPEIVTHWGHPLMMGIVIVAVGGSAAVKGWQIRRSEDVSDKNESAYWHKKAALWLTTFISLGWTGGVLSLVMQGEPIFESPHFWTGTIAIGMLMANGALSITKFLGKDSLRTVHAYVGSAAIALLVVHAALGINLGLSF
ncbi:MULTISPECIES: DUF4079 domain-containing protein [Cyanophyceae]|uniref:DUF4079 domain-containing protein n=1 Tax=Cyanophyceae TaxID=3028117 RepID=UPI00074586D2|nr:MULTISPECIES: DUF4079 domain-containing protein [Cyanophyceae]AMA08132.1 hypothetical protein AWQ23_01680 [Picosynechococcus sp. PCC 73109]ANV86271.1 hypothetical protein AWQ22_01595 [Picosynechococcus sp. PCC 7117]ANV89442.1 hypothetical protein AWQ24_01625 [Picosynechococcus sp. PCC 8807]